MDLFQSGQFLFHSGETCDWKIEADALSDDEVGVLARVLRRYLPPFAAVVGVPRGGLRIAGALYPHCTRDPRHPILIVDDVFTTGNSLEGYRQGMVGSTAPGQPSPKGAVLFARRPVPSWVTALFQMPAEKTSNSSVPRWIGRSKERQ